MKLSCLIIWLAIASGCSSYAVHCDSHLRPINVFPHTAGEGKASASPRTPAESP